MTFGVYDICRKLVVKQFNVDLLSVFLDAPIYKHLRMVFSDVIDIAEAFSMDSQRVQYF